MDLAEVSLTAEQRTYLHQRLEGVRELFAMESLFETMADTVHGFSIWELCCSPNSTLTSACLRLKLSALRKTIEAGYDFEKGETKDYLIQDYGRERPKKIWLSLRCTEWSNIQNLNQRDWKQQEALRKKRLRGRKQIRVATELLRHALEDNPDVHIYWEWPKSAHQGWYSDEMMTLQRIIQNLSSYGIFWTQIDGCTFEMTSPDKLPIKKSWLVMTTDEEFHHSCRRFCTGDHEHRPDGMIGMGSKAVASTAFYPQGMAEMIARHWKKQWARLSRSFQEKDIINELHTLEEAFAKETDAAISNLRIPLEQIKPETKAMAQKLLTQIHRSSGHPSNTALARLCRDKKFPAWVIQLAQELHCDACQSIVKGEQRVPNVSLGTKPQPWQLVGMDIFEIPFPKQECKGRYLLCVDLAMRLMSITLLQQVKPSQTGVDSGNALIEAFTNGWLMHRPKPLWVVVDAQTSLAKGEFVQFAQLLGFGVAVMPGEAHYLHGGTESAVKTVKSLMKRYRFEYPKVPPKLLGMIAAAAHNNNYMLHGFSPVQWAYGYDPQGNHNSVDPLEVNVRHGTQPGEFWELQRSRDRAAELWRQEHAKTTWTKATNTVSRPPREFQPGDWVCVWRKATWRARRLSKKKGQPNQYNPEARFVGPGRVIFQEPAVLPGQRSSIVWVIMATQIWRCSVDQLRYASETEVNWEILEKGSKLTRPVMDQLQQLSRVIDVTKEDVYDWENVELPEKPEPHGAGAYDRATTQAMTAEDWEHGLEEMADEWTRRVRARTEAAREGKRPAAGQDGRSEVQQRVRQWSQLVSVNENRRREGLPPLMQLPELSQMEEASEEKRQRSGEPQHFNMVENDVTLSEEAYYQVLSKIEELEETAKHMSEIEQLRDMLQIEKREEAQLLELMAAACDQEDEVCEISFDVDHPAMLLQQGFVYTKAMLQSSSKEVTYTKLTPQQKELFDEAMAREIAEVLRSQALRAATEVLGEEEVRERLIPMRWVLTWKFIPGVEPLASGGAKASAKKPKKPDVLDETGQWKAKARLVLLGFKHPDLAARDPRTGQRKLSTAAPTLTRTARNLLLQAAALDQHEIESADAKSAFLQSARKLEGKPLYNRGVDEVAHALGVKPGMAIQIVGAFYGLTIAPRLFWLDADDKLRRRGGIVHPCERCLWVFFDDPPTKVVGRIGSHVDDFLIIGDGKDVKWQQIRNSLKEMYLWSPWQKGKFTFAGCEISQLQDYSVTVTQAEFSNALQPIEISNDKARSDNDPLSDAETSQFRGAIMKAAWRAGQTGPQFAARVNVTASKTNKATVQDLREANKILKEMKRTSTVGLTFPAFNVRRAEPFSWEDMVMLHFGDAAQSNRHDGGSSGGYITGMSVADILGGAECPMSVIDWRSWRLERATKGSNGCEAQALYEAEDRGWRCRILWSLLYSPYFHRGEQDKMAAKIESLLIMDSRGLYDAVTLSETALCGMSSAKTGTEAMAIQAGTRPQHRCYATWVPSDVNLADALTKVAPEAMKVMQL